MMQQQRFREQRHLGRTELELAMMADDHVLNQDPQLGWKIGHALELLVEHAQADDNVTE